MRPEHLRLVHTPEAGWPATVLTSQRSSACQRVRARLHDSDAEIEFELPAGLGTPTHAVGAEITLGATHFGVFPR